MTFISPPPSTPRSGTTILIFPGGGYRKCTTSKEGTQIALKFAQDGHCSFVASYDVGPIRVPFARSRKVEPIVRQGLSALEYVRSKSKEGSEQRGNVDPRRICICGFSAGGHLALAVLEKDAERRSQVQNPPPSIAATILVYPTMRSPTCWCILGGLHIVPSSLGKNWEDEGEHRYCYGSNVKAMGRLLPSLSPHVFCCTVKGDMLLPKHKNAGLLIGAMRTCWMNKVGIIEDCNEGPWYLPHGIGWHKGWGERAKDFLKRAMDNSPRPDNDDAHNPNEPDSKKQQRGEMSSTIMGVVR